MTALGVIYGIHILFLVYGVTYLSARSLFKGGKISIIIILGKYMLYYAAIVFGFKHFPTGAVLIGFTAGIYLSLPFLYLVNKKVSKV